MKAVTRNTPNIVTCMNLVAGCLAIFCGSKGNTPLWGLHGWEWACIFIGIAALADFFDGFCARVLKAYSDLGKELDSLCDLVSFGVAPAIMVSNLLIFRGMPEWMALCSLLIPVAGAIRLARFNIDTRQASSFKGLPIPSNAIFWAGYCGMIMEGADFLLLPGVYYPILLFECWLMISPMRLFSLKFKNYRFRENLPRYLLIAGSAFLIFCMGLSGLVWVIVYYIFLSFTFKVKP